MKKYLIIICLSLFSITNMGYAAGVSTEQLLQQQMDLTRDAAEHMYRTMQDSKSSNDIRIQKTNYIIARFIFIKSIQITDLNEKQAYQQSLYQQYIDNSIYLNELFIKNLNGEVPTWEFIRELENNTQLVQKWADSFK